MGNKVQALFARLRRHPRLLGTLLLVAATVGHWLFWYDARPRPALPDDGLPARLLARADLPLAAWVPYPHQNLGALAEWGLDPGALRAALRLAELPEPALPRFGHMAVPPSRALAVATDRRGDRFVVAAQVYPAVAAFSRLAGFLAGNPWLAGGEVTSDDRRLVVAWHGTVWTASSMGPVSFEEGGTFPPSSTGPDPGPRSSPGRPAVLVAEARETRAPLPVGRYYLFADEGGIELVSDGAVETPPERAEGMARTRTLLLAVSGADGPLGRGGQALALIGQDAADIAELPRGAVLFRPGLEERWDLPAEGLLKMAGHEPRAGSAAGLGLVATDDVGLAGAEALAPDVGTLLGSSPDRGGLVFGLWLELAPAAAEVGRLRRGLERAPLWSRDQMVRWREGDRFLVGLAEPWSRMVLTVRQSPPELWLRVEPAAAKSPERAEKSPSRTDGNAD